MQNCRNVFNKASVFGISENQLTQHLISVEFFQLNSVGAREPSCAIDLRHYQDSSICRQYMQLVYQLFLNVGEQTNIAEAVENVRISTKPTQTERLGAVNLGGNQSISSTYQDLGSQGEEKMFIFLPLEGEGCKCL